MVMRKNSISVTSSPFPSPSALPLLSRVQSRGTSFDIWPLSVQCSPRAGVKAKEREGRLRTIQISQADLQKNQVKLGLIATYRNLSRLARKETMNIRTVPELPYFTEIQRQKLKPELSVFTHKRSQTEIHFQEFGLGDEYAAAVSIAISNNPLLEILNFKNNRLRESGCLRIIESLRLGRVKELNLSENDIGVKGAEVLSQLLRESQIIEKLSLEKAVQKRKALNMILESTAVNKSLTELNVARNGIGNSSGIEFNTLLTINSTLKRLDLHWNTIGGLAAVQLFQGLRDNLSLQELDISWNSLGNYDNLDICKSLCQVFGENLILKHLDLSYNHFTYTECEKLADGVKANHTILGIHMVGNSCKVDSRGFLIPIVIKAEAKVAHTFQRMLSPRACTVPHPSNCWLCEKWTAVTFEWNFQQVAWNRRLKHFAQEHKDSREPVFLHLDIDGFQPELMNKDEDGVYTVERAVPSTGVKFFFTYRGYAQVSFAYSLFHVPEPDSIEVSFFNSVSKHYALVLQNQYQPKEDPCSLEETFPVIPRPGPWVYELDSAEGPIIIPEWTIEKSVFRTYKFDNEQLMRECLDFDWTHSHLDHLIKSEFEQMAVKTVLLHIYYDLKEAFRHFCSFEKFSANKMTLSALTDLANRMNLIDNKRFRLSDLDLNIRASLMDSSGQHIAAINRTEFMEIMVRTALDKYLKSGLCQTESTALSRFAAVHVKPVLGKYSTDKWRKDRYLNEEIDLLYTTYIETLQTYYARYSGKYAQAGEKPWMSVEEFIQCCKALCLTSKSFTSRLYSLCFQLSLMTHKDLARSKRQFHMVFVEFLEGIARVAEFADLEEPEEAMTRGKWGEDPLDEKLESILIEISGRPKPENPTKKSPSAAPSPPPEPS